MLSSEPTPRHPVVPNPFTPPPQAEAQSQPAPSNIRAYSYNDDDSVATVSVHPPDDKNPFENRIRSQSAQSESDITTGFSPSNPHPSNESEATTQPTRSAQPSRPSQPSQPSQPAQSDISTRSVNQESLGESDITTQSSQTETNHPAPETTTQPLNDTTAKGQSSTAVPAPSSAKDQPAPADTPVDSKAQDSCLETDIIAQQDPAVVHPDRSNLNYDPKTGEGLAIEMEIHAIKAAIEAGLIPSGTSVERDAVARGEHVSEKNKEAFRKAQQQPDAAAKNLEQKEEESKQMDNMVGMTKDEMVKTKDGGSESKTDEVEPSRDAAAEVKEE